MGEDIVSGQSSVILYEGSPLERIAASAVLPRNKDVLQEFLHSRFFLPSDIVMGRYGVTGFLIIDTRPEERWESYTDTNLYYISHSLDHRIHIPDEDRNDPIRVSHYINTDKGFKMIRYFLLPNNVRTFFESDEDLGEPMVRKCCRTIPKWFDEDEAREVFGELSGDEEGDKLVAAIIEGITPRLRQIGETELKRYDFKHQRYLSFHPWRFVKDVLAVGEDSIVEAIGNFDKFLGTMDRRGVLRKRNLQTNGAAEYRLALPSTLPYKPLST